VNWLKKGTIRLIVVHEFVIDPGNESKFWSHGLTKESVAQVLANFRVIVRNRKGRAADYMVVGRDHSGRCIAIPITPTHDPYVWRPATAWFCKRSEAAKLR
jgi:hypothetical protein